jgi:uncharacterized protein (TIGR03000 family)
MPLSGQEAASGVYTYRHGYDPGYYGSSRLPIDPGAKLGQAITQGASQYWYMPRSPESAPRPTTAYVVRVTRLPQKMLEEDPNAALIVAHVPGDAQISFEGEPMVQKGDLRLFTSPPLTPGKNYTYTVRIRWAEAGRQVSQTGLVPVRAGEVHCIDSGPAEQRGSQAGGRAEVLCSSEWSPAGLDGRPDENHRERPARVPVLWRLCQNGGAQSR